MGVMTAGPPSVLQLAGHPVRWRLLADLAASDRTVRELTGRIGQPQNLVSYHLGKLRGSGLVSARRSSADGRDSYYTVDLARLGAELAQAGGALHPGLTLASAPPGTDAGPSAGSGERRRRVLFLCTGNSARSQIAEALLRERSGGRVDAASAGSRPKPIHPDAIRVMGETYGIDLTSHRPKHLDEVAEERFDQVVSLCDRVREVCPEFPGRPRAAHWSIPDPSAGPATFAEVAADIEVRVGFLLAALAAAPPGTSSKEES